MPGTPALERGLQASICKDNRDVGGDAWRFCGKTGQLVLNTEIRKSNNEEKRETLSVLDIVLGSCRRFLPSRSL